MTALIVEVSLIKSQLVCSSNCETCTSGAVSDCSLCASGYFQHPTTSACELSCPNGYYEDATLRTCPQCSTGCLTCTAAGTTNCPSCAPQYFSPSANECTACDQLCNGCTASGNTACQACATNIYSVENTSLKCVADCSHHGSNFYLDGSICKQCDVLCATCTGAGNTLCSSCAVSKYAVDSTSTCVSACSNYATNYYLDSSTCRQCDALCATCFAAGNSACSTCASGKYTVDGVANKCVSACSDHAANFFLDGNVCKQCNAECATCSGPDANNCDTCVTK